MSSIPFENRTQKCQVIKLLPNSGVHCISIFRYRGAVYADMGHFERCITLWMYALDMQQKMLEPLSPMTQSSLLSFAELFSYMMSEGRNGRNNNNNNPNVNANGGGINARAIALAANRPASPGPSR